jgi:NAD(P)-dependent dehydrogenase (short-subunit alcohol dehydrogenase family)
MTDTRLDGKVAIVTGATGGWGGGSAVALARRGATVVLNSRTQTKLDAFARRLERDGHVALGVAQDVRSAEGASSLVARTVAAFGRVDVLVNCAGVTVTDAPPPDPSAQEVAMPLYGGTLLDMAEETWKYVIDAELTAVFNCTKAAATQMVAQGDGGAIVSVVGTILGAAGQSAHAAAKGGLMNGIWSWSDELRAHGITVNGVRGYVRSILTDPGFDIEAHDFEADRGRGELPTAPLDAGELVAWLASPDAAEVTGAYIGIDGPRLTIWEPNLPGTAVFRSPAWTVDELAATFGPIVKRRPRRPSMTEVVQDLFSARDRDRAAAAKAHFADDEEPDAGS